MRLLARAGTKAGFAVLDQGVFAGANLIANVLLARWVAADEYGAFAVSYSVFLLLGAIHTSILTEPMLVHGPRKYWDDVPRYTSILTRIHWCAAIVVAAVLSVAAVIALHAGAAAVARALAGLAFASPFVLLSWLLRRAVYVQSRPGLAASSSAVYLIALVGIMAAVQGGGHTSSVTTLLAMGGASWIASFWLSRRLNGDSARRHDHVGGIVPVLKDHWEYGKWSIGATVLRWMPANIYVPIMAMTAGLESSGALRAVMNGVLPILQIYAALASIMLAEFAKLARTGPDPALWSRVRLALIGTLGVAVVLWLTTWVFARDILLLLYGDRYTEHATTLGIAGAVSIFSASIAVAGSVLRATGRPQSIVWAYGGANIVVLPLGVWLTVAHGVPGAVVAIVVTLALTALLLWRAQWRALCGARLVPTATEQ